MSEELKKIKLVTADDKHVAIGLIPPSKTMPDVVSWGPRVFQWATEPAEPIENCGDPVYRECFHVAAVVRTKAKG